VAERSGRAASSIVALAAVAAMACGQQDDRPEPLPGWMLTADSMGVPATQTAVTGHLARDELLESSGVASSTTQSGLLFTINDSGHDPILYATDSTGADRGAWRVTGATNDDWEAIAVGPCAGSDGPNAARSVSEQCVYIGDTGDNAARKQTRTIYRVSEPTAESAGFLGATPAAARLQYNYPDGPQDVEAMYVGPGGDVVLISKRPSEDGSGRLRPARVYRLSAAAWTEPMPATAELVDSLPIVPGSAPWRAITDAALAPDNRHVAVRTYTQIFMFAAEPGTGAVVTSTAPAICNVAALGVVGEGVAWLDALGRLVLTSEGKAASVHVVTCQVPAR
jgi:hypothetical protein